MTDADKAGTGTSNKRMQHTSAFLWYMEDDPHLRSTIQAITVLAGRPDWDYLRARMDRASRQLPMFRQCVQPPPLRLGPPRLVQVSDLDLDYHMRRIGVPEPGTWRDVLDFAQQSEMVPFDHQRPLWEFTLVEGLQDGGSALLTKLHHSLTDGIGGMQVAALVVDPTADRPAIGTLPDAPAGRLHGQLELMAESLVDSASEMAHQAGRAARGALPAAVDALVHPRRAAGDVLSTAASVAEMVKPIQRTLSPVMTGRGLGRRFDTLDIPLAELKTAGRRLECSVNDIFLCALTGGLRYYHEEHGAELSELRIGLPISLRTPEDDIGGNHATLVRFVLPVDSPDPQVRIAVARRLVTDWRNAPSNRLTQGIAFGLNLAPRGYIGEMIKHVDLLASNVPGLTTPVYLAGARVTGYYPFGPTLGSALNVTLMSYAGTCSIGINADTAAVPDLDTLVRCLHKGFDEVLGCRPAPRSARHPA